MQKKNLFIGLSLIPLLVALIGFITLLKSPYLGIGFESREGKWFITSIDPNGPAAKFKELVGNEVVAIADLKLERYDLVSAFCFVPSSDSYKHFWDAEKYFDKHIKPGTPINVTVRLQGEYFKTAEPLAKLSVIPEMFYRGYGFL